MLQDISSVVGDVTAQTVTLTLGGLMLLLRNTRLLFVSMWAFQIRCYDGRKVLVIVNKRKVTTMNGVRSHNFCDSNDLTFVVI